MELLTVTIFPYTQLLRLVVYICKYIAQFTTILNLDFERCKESDYV